MTIDQSATFFFNARFFSYDRQFYLRHPNRRRLNPSSGILKMFVHFVETVSLLFGISGRRRPFPLIDDLIE